jgi:hypothetical protein
MRQIFPVFSRDTVSLLSEISIPPGSSKITPCAEETPAAPERLERSAKSRHGREAYAAGVAAYDRGNWRQARRLLPAALADDPRKACREHAREILDALGPDWFALRIAGGLGLALATISLAALI